MRIAAAAVALAVVFAACGGSDAPTRSDPPPERPAAQDALTVGVFPFLDANGVDAIYGPLVALLGDHLGVAVRLQTASAYEIFTERLVAGEYDIAMVQPFELVMAVDQGFRPLARVEEPLRSIVVAAPGSARVGLASLAGATVATPPEGAAVSQLFELQLAKIGLDPAVDVDIVRRISHSACLSDLGVGAVDACVTAQIPLNRFEAERQTMLPVVALSPGITPIGYVARPGLDDALVTAATAFLLDLEATDAGRAVLAGLRIDRYVAIDDGDYDDVRELSSAKVPTS